MKIEQEFESLPSWDSLYTLIKTIQTFFTALPVKELTFKRQQGSTTKYDYTFTMQDNRKWKQEVIFDSPPSNDPQQTFNVNDAFRLSEFAEHRKVRDAFITAQLATPIIKLEASM